MENLAVIGCGTMGHSIALNAAWAGIPVLLYGISQQETELASVGIGKKLDTLYQNDLITEQEIRSLREKICMTRSMDETTRDSTFIIEAIPENIDLKRDLFRRLDSLCGQNVVLASNTSGLNPSDIASGMLWSERFVVTHFWNPAHLIPLVEVVRGKKTDDKTVERAIRLLHQMMKKPIEVKKEIPGFVGNRLQYALFREAQYLLEEGIASKEDIDAAVTYSIGRRLPITGPLLSADMGGLDVFAAISDYLFKDLSNAGASFPTLKKLVSENNFGAKSGKGYYDWDLPFSERASSKREAELIRFYKMDLALNDADRNREEI